MPERIAPGRAVACPDLYLTAYATLGAAQIEDAMIALLLRAEAAAQEIVDDSYSVWVRVAETHIVPDHDGGVVVVIRVRLDLEARR